MNQLTRCLAMLMAAIVTFTGIQFPAHAASYEDSLVAHYDLSSATGLTNTNVSFVEDAEAGTTVAKFNGGNHSSYLKLPNSAFSSVSATTGMTISLWFKADASTGDWSRLFDLGYSNASNMPFVFLTPTMNFSYNTTQGTWYPEAAVLTDISGDVTPEKGVWNHVAVTLSSSEINMYLNGVLIGNSGTDCSMALNHFKEWYSLDLGASKFLADADYVGFMRDLRIYNSVLTFSDVGSVYEEGGGEIAGGDGGELPSFTLNDMDVTENSDGIITFPSAPTPYTYDHNGRQNVHDPSMIKVGDTYYMYSTGIVSTDVEIRTSNNMVDWTYVGTAGLMPANAEVSSYVASNLWAPEVYKHGDEYRLYYSCSGLSGGNSCIALATSTNPAGPFTHKGIVVKSTTSEWTNGGINAIDAGIINDREGNMYMVWGSFFGGIKIAEMDASTGFLKTANGSDGTVIVKRSIPFDNGACEGPFVFYNPDTEYYYVVVSYGNLLPTDRGGGYYSMRIGRSKNITGPYLDYNGNDMADSTLEDALVGYKLATNYKFSTSNTTDNPVNAQGWWCIGGNSVYEEDGKWYCVAHARVNTKPDDVFVNIRQMFWTEDGWPLCNPSLYAGEKEQTIPVNYVPGKYERIEFTYTKETTSKTAKTMQLYPDYTAVISSTRGTWSYSGINTITVEFGDTTETYKIVPSWDWENKRATYVIMGIDEDNGLQRWGKKVGYYVMDEGTTPSEPDNTEDMEAVANAIEALTGPASEVVDDDIILPSAGENGTTIVWTSSPSGIIAADGSVTLPAETTEVTLTATVSKGNVSDTKTFTVTVLSAQDCVNNATEALEGTIPDSTDSDLILPTEGENGATITWSSSHPDIIGTDGTVTIPAETTNVTLTATIKKGDVIVTKTFTVQVVSAKDEADSIAAAIVALRNQIPAIVDDTIVLPIEGECGTTISWSSSVPGVIGVDGTVILPAETTEVILTATVSKGGSSKKESFTVKVLSAQECVNNAREALTGTIPASTITDLTLPTEGENGTTITWSSSHPDIIETDGTVTIPAETTNVTLTATIQKGEVTATETFTVQVIALSDEINSISEAIKALRSQIPSEVDDDISLPETGERNTSISWTSTPQGIIAEDGSVVLPSETTEVTLIATVSKGTTTKTADFVVKVLSESECVDNAKEALEGKIPSITMTDLDLPTEGENGTTITWSSTHPDIIGTDGTVEIPNETTNVTLTAAIHKGETVEQVTFTVKVVASEDDEFSVKAAIDALKKQIPLETYENIELSTTGEEGTIISWNITPTGIIATDGSVTLPSETTNVTLTATVEKGEYSEEKVFTVRVLSEAECVARAKEALNGKVPAEAYGDISLPSEGENGTSISWTSIPAGIIGSDGTVTTPSTTTQVTLVATITKGSISDTKEFTVNVIALFDEISAITETIGVLRNSIPSNTVTDIELPVEGENGTNIEWKITPEGIIATDGKVTLPSETTDVTLIATVSKGTSTREETFTVKVWSEEDCINASIDALEGTIPMATTTDLILPTEGKFGTTISWTSEPEGIIATDGKITLPDVTTEVTLTATFTKGDTIKTKEYTVRVISYMDEIDVILADLTALKEKIPSETYEDIEIPTEGESGTTITWESSDVNIIAVDGTVTLPSETTNVILTAYLSTEGLTKKQNFIVKVWSETDCINNAISTLNEKMPTYVSKDISLPTEGKMGTSIEWKSSDESLITAEGKVVIPSKRTEVILTATITKGTTSKNQEYVVTVGKALTTNVALEKQEIKLTATDQISSMDNPFYGKNLEAMQINYKIIIPEGAYKSGYDGLFSFYTVEGGGRVSIQSNPYICYNQMAPEGEANYWADINSPAEGENNLLENWNYEDEYAVTLYMDAEKCDVYIDGVLVSESVKKDGNATYEDVLSAISGYEKLSFGTGEKQTGFWGTQVCTLRDVQFSSMPYVRNEHEKEIVLEAAVEEMDNPLYGMDLKEAVLDFTVNFAEDAIMTGWDGLAAFYDNEEHPLGRMSIQSAPYICFNDWDGNWMDINQPPAGGNGQIAGYERGEDVHYYISITADKITMRLNDEEVFFTENKSEDAVYRDMLDYISECKKFSWGAAFNENFQWNIEKCTIKDAAVTGYKSEVEASTVENKFRIVDIPDQQYTGSVIKPQIVVYDGKKYLRENVDYKLKYTNNKNVSTTDKKACVTVIGKGNYDKAKSSKVYFNIIPREITEDNVTVTYKPVLNVKYKKGAVVGQTQSVKVKFGKVTVPAKQYTVTYMKDGAAVEKLTEAGNYQMVIQTKEGSSFNGTLTYDITLTDKILMSALKIKTKNQSYDTVSANTLFDEWKVTYKNKNVLAEGQKLTDLFDISAVEDLLPGTKTVTFTAKADSPYYGSKDATFKITGVSIAKAKLTGFQSKMAYTGEAVTQDVTLVMNKGKKTEYTIDPAKYTVSYANNTNAGKAKMIITGKDEFTGTKITKTFTIGKSALKADSVSVNFIGQEAGSSMTVSQNILGATPDIEVKKGDQTLEKGTDYTVSYSSNKAVGTGKVTVKFKGNYSGTLKNVLTFQIVAKDVTDSSIEMVVTDLKYSSKDKYKAKVAVYDNGKKLATSQYTIGAVTDLVYEKDETGADTKCGTAKAVISGKKNYTGTKEVTVVIKEALLSSVKAKVDGTFFYENGKEIRPTELTVTIGSGKKKQTLTQGVDYIIVEDGYKNNVKAGRATLTIQGIGKYGGTKEVKFTILPRWLKLN